MMHFMSLFPLCLYAIVNLFSYAFRVAPRTQHLVAAQVRRESALRRLAEVFEKRVAAEAALHSELQAQVSASLIIPIHSVSWLEFADYFCVPAD